MSKDASLCSADACVCACVCVFVCLCVVCVCLCVCACRRLFAIIYGPKRFQQRKKDREIVEK
jgi:hypothetical protein